MKRCKRCGNEFDPRANSPEACRFHPGTLRDFDRFAEGVGAPGDYWSCCKKQVVSEGQPVPGCQVGPHLA
jgi:hypothetical protein